MKIDATGLNAAKGQERGERPSDRNAGQQSKYRRQQNSLNTASHGATPVYEVCNTNCGLEYAVQNPARQAFLCDDEPASTTSVAYSHPCVRAMARRAVVSAF